MTPRQVAVDLGLTTASVLGWSDVVDLAVAAYWRNRRPRRLNCGSRYGYFDHRNRDEQPCEDCRHAWALNVAISRRRAARNRAGVGPQGEGVPTPALPVAS